MVVYVLNEFDIFDNYKKRNTKMVKITIEQINRLYKQGKDKNITGFYLYLEKETK